MQLFIVVSRAFLSFFLIVAFYVEIKTHMSGLSKFLEQAHTVRVIETSAEQNSTRESFAPLYRLPDSSAAKGLLGVFHYYYFCLINPLPKIKTETRAAPGRKC